MLANFHVKFNDIKEKQIRKMYESMNFEQLVISLCWYLTGFLSFSLLNFTSFFLVILLHSLKEILTTSAIRIIRNLHLHSKITILATAK